MIDEAPGCFRFLLAGPSARKLRRGKANLLPGHVHAFYLHPRSAGEFGDDFELERALVCGSLPGVHAEPDARERARTLRSYADTYLREEVQAEALVRDIGGHARLLDHVAIASGNVLNLHSLCKHAEVPYETARRYLEVLEDTLLVHRIPAWSGSARQTLISHPRLYLFDLGVRNALLHRPLDRVLPDDRGLLLEHLVANELLRVCRAHGVEVFHYRTRHGTEVDFVLRLGDEIWAIEVKAARDLASADLRGVHAFAAAEPGCKRKLVLFGGRHAQKRDGVEAIPVQDFLTTLDRQVAKRMSR